MSHLAAVLAFLLLFASGPAASAAAPREVLPPDAQLRGLSHAEWSAEWWQWAAGLPANGHPLPQEGTVDCGQGQERDHVWFLGGNTTGGSTQRTCSIPSGTFLLIPLLNVECSSVEGNGTTPEELRACVEQRLFRIADLTMTINGTTLNGLSDYVFTSPPFEITFANPNVFGVPAGTGLSVARGAWVLVKPLAVGDHTITFGGSFPEAGFSLDVTYHIEVQPRGKYAPL